MRLVAGLARLVSTGGVALLLVVSAHAQANGKAASDAKANTEKNSQSAQPDKGSAATVATPQQAPPAPARATNGSLFTDDGRIVDLLSDFKPRRIGDTVFVDVVESSAASVSSSAKTSRDSGALGAAVLGAASLPPAIGAGAAGVVGALGTKKFDGKGATDRSTSIKARIAARVVEVLPSGDLKIEAEKILKVNKEEERLTLSGVVRARDVSPDNSIASTSVADLRVLLNGKGVASSNNGPGWLARFLEKISPF